MTTVDLVLSIALALSLVMHLIGLVSYVRLANRQITAMCEIENTIAHATTAIRSGFKTVRRKIEHSDELTSQKRREMLDLMLDSERRCMDQIRDLGHALALQGIKPPGTIQISTGSGAANQAGDNRNEQRQ